MTNKKKTQSQTRSRQKIPNPLDEINKNIEAFQQLVAQVGDLMRDGFPYRDALRPRIEFQIRETIRQIFGEQSSEFQHLKDHCLESTGEADIADTVVMLRALLEKLEHQRLRLMGITPPPSTKPGASAAGSATAAHPSQISPASVTPPSQPPSPVAAIPPRSLPAQDRQPAPAPAITPVVAQPSPTAASTPQARAAAYAPPPSTAAPARHESANKASPSGPSDALERLKKIADRFHAVARQLRLRGEYRPTIEVEDQQDVQDLLFALLRFEFEDVGVEEWSPGYAGIATQTSFFLLHGRLAIVVKKTQAGRGVKEITDELVVDAKRYATHPECKVLFCFVYDPEGRIGNPRGLEAQLTRMAGTLNVSLLISPK